MCALFTRLLLRVVTGFHDSRQVEAQRQSLTVICAQTDSCSRDSGLWRIQGRRLTRIKEHQSARPDIASAKIRRIAFQVQACAAIPAFAAFGKPAYPIGPAQTDLLPLHQHITAPLPVQCSAELPAIPDQLRITCAVTQNLVFRIGVGEIHLVVFCKIGLFPLACLGQIGGIGKIEINFIPGKFSLSGKCDIHRCHHDLVIQHGRGRIGQLDTPVIAPVQTKRKFWVEYAYAFQSMVKARAEQSAAALKIGKAAHHCIHVGITAEEFQAAAGSVERDIVTAAQHFHPTGILWRRDVLNAGNVIRIERIGIAIRKSQPGTAGFRRPGVIE